MTCKLRKHPRISTSSNFKLCCSSTACTAVAHFSTLPAFTSDLWPLTFRYDFVPMKLPCGTPAEIFLLMEFVDPIWTEKVGSIEITLNYFCDTVKINLMPHTVYSVLYPGPPQLLSSIIRNKASAGWILSDFFQYLQSFQVLTKEIKEVACYTAGRRLKYSYS